MTRLELLGSKEFWSTQIAHSIWVINGQKQNIKRCEAMADKIVDAAFMKRIHEVYDLGLKQTVLPPEAIATMVGQMFIGKKRKKK